LKKRDVTDRIFFLAEAQMQNHDNDVPPEAPKLDLNKIGLGTEDFRGPYGYGRRAYRPDRTASYSFEPRKRTLPLSFQRKKPR
jgi:hypothetical protein